MTLLSLHDLLLRRSDRDLLRTASFDLVQGMRLGIVGANGCGKSTLLSALAGRARAAEGRVLRPPGVEVAWLGQHVTAPPGSSLWDLAQAELASLQALARELERSLPGAQAGTDAAMRYAELLASFDERGGFTAEARLRAGLERVGLAAERWPVEAHNASGGERQRARLVGVLTSSADVLLLDEPSNHLDLDARAWLAAQLRERRGALVLASHDRALLEQVCTHIGRIEAGQLQVRRGGYQEVSDRIAGEERGRGRREGQRLRRVAELERMAAELARFGHRGAAARRRRALREHAELRAAAEPRPSGRAPPTLTRPASAAAPRVVLRARHLRAEGLFEDVALTLRSGERLALVGPSGSGKSTLLALIAGARASDDARAELAWADGTSLLYLDQVERGLDPGESPLALLERWVSAPRARAALALVQLGLEAWTRPSTTLSGGERARVALALVSVREADVLVLDEPTNDLDLPGIEALEGVLRTTRACVLIASHDEALVRALEPEVCALEAGALVRYRGGIDGYRRGTRRLEPQRHTGSIDSAGTGALPDASSTSVPEGTAAAAAEEEAALEAALRAAEAALEDPLRLGPRDLERWRARRADAEAALFERIDAALPAPSARFRTREAGLVVCADRDGDGLAVWLEGGPGVRVVRVGRLAHLAPVWLEESAAQTSPLPWAWRALCHGAARLALYLLPIDAVQVASDITLEGGALAPHGDGWWVATRRSLEGSERWLRPSQPQPQRGRRRRRRRPCRAGGGPTQR